MIDNSYRWDAEMRERTGLRSDQIGEIHDAIQHTSITNREVLGINIGVPSDMYILYIPDWDSLPKTLFGVPIIWDGRIPRGSYTLTLTPPIDPAPAQPSILDDARERVVEDRHEDYGQPVDNMRRTADLWNALGRARYGDEWCEIQPADVPAFMRMLKEARIAHKPKRDSFVDIAGWAAVEEECLR